MGNPLPGWTPLANVYGQGQTTPYGTQFIQGGQVGQTAGSVPYQSDLSRLDTSAGATQASQGTIGAQLQAMPGQNSPQQVGPDTVQGAAIQQRGFNQQMAAGNQLAARGNQNLDVLQAASQGRVPSAAELQGRMQLQQALANTAAMGASSRGGADSRAAAQRQAMQAQAGLSGQVINQAQVGRAAEQAQAQNAYANAIQGQQGVRLQGAAEQAQMAQAQAGLTQQANLANQGAGMQAQLANQSAGQQQQALNQQSLLGAAGAYQTAYNNQMGAVDYNNQLNQMDFNRQQAMNQQAIQVYGAQAGVSIGAYQADQARAAAKTQAQYQAAGAGLNAAGNIASAGIRSGLFGGGGAGGSPLGLNAGYGY